MYTKRQSASQAPTPILTKDTYLSLSNTKALKGIFAIFVLIHHIYQYGLHFQNALDYIPQWLGCWAVGMFFFYSGYGLMLSSRKKDYLTTFLRKRWIPFYVFYVFLIAVFCIYEWALHIDFTLGNFLQSFLFGYTIVPLAWYLQTTLLIYLLYWAVFRLISKDFTRIIVFTVALVVYCLICYKYGLSSTWYESVFCYSIGMLWVYWKDKMDAMLERREIWAFLAFFFLFIVTTLLQFKLGVIPKMFSIIFFALTITAFSYLIANTHIINNRFTQFFGKHSLEIYICQGFFLLLRRYTHLFDNLLIYIPLTIIGTILVAMPMHIIYGKLTHTCKKILKVA